MRKRTLPILLCLVLLTGLFPTTAFAGSDDAHECVLCGAIYYGDDVVNEVWSDCCGVCLQASGNDCYLESHCPRCSGCFMGSVMFWCDSCGMCKDCQEDDPGTHCSDCGDCYIGLEDDLCGNCFRCESCAEDICPDCGFCDECANDESDPMHCIFCGDCFESAGLAHDSKHCPNCCIVCEQCFMDETCVAEDDEAEFCDECGLCMDCCYENRNAASGCDVYCIESSEWEEHYCEECGECWCEHEQCELCGLCADCCEANSDCSDGMCVEDSEYEDHFCDGCGACAHDFEEICFTCGYCDECCLDARLIYGCDCSYEEGVCIEDTDFDEHLKTVHPDAEVSEHSCTPKAVWHSDMYNHWRPCRFCDEEKHFTEKTAHNYDDHGKCIACGYQQGSRVYFTRQPKSVKVKVSDELDYSYLEDDSVVYGATHQKNNTVTFRVSARGEGTLTYQWYQYDPDHPEDGFALEDVKNLAFEGDTTNRLTIHVPEDACERDDLVFFCMVYDKVEGETSPKSARSENASIIAGHRYTVCSSARDSTKTGMIYEKYGKGYSTYLYFKESSGHYWHCCGIDHSFNGSDPTSAPTKTRDPLNHRYTKVEVIQATFVLAEAQKGEFHDIYKYTCADCGHSAYVEKHDHQYAVITDGDRITELVEEGEYVNGKHLLECTVDGCGKTRRALHDWTYRIAYGPSDTSNGALHRECSECGYYEDGVWSINGTKTYWDRSNLIVQVDGGSATRTLMFPNESLTVTPTPKVGYKVTGWTATYTNYNNSTGTTKDVTAKLTVTCDDATGKWKVEVPSFAAMGVTGGGRLNLVAKTTACTHTKTTLVDACEACCIHDGYTGDTVCADCGKLVETGDPIAAPATEHSGLTFVSGTAKTGSCTEYGYEGDYKCGVCGDTVRGKRLGKTHGATYLDGFEAPTCTKEGYSGDQRCKKCDGLVKRGKVLLVQHGETELVGQNLEVCIGNGYTGNKVCKDCGAVVEYGYATAPLGHDWNGGVTVTLSGHRGGIYTRYTCQRCGATKTEPARGVGSVVDGVIQSVNFSCSGYAVGGTNDGITVTPDDVTKSILLTSKSYTAGILKDDPVKLGKFVGGTTLKDGETIEAGKTYYLVITVQAKSDYTYSDKLYATLDGTKYASFIGDTTIKVTGVNGRPTQVPVKVAVFKLSKLAESTTGVTVSGTAASWNDTDNARYYLYPATTEDATIRAQWKTDGTVGGYTYTATKGAASSATVDGKSMYAQGFSFTGVASGSYKLVIFKEGKYVPKIVPITVGASAYDCGELKLWLYGDVNCDGVANTGDATQINRYYNGLGNIISNGSAAELADRILAADVNCDGSVNTADATQINRYYNGLGSYFVNFK